MDDPTALSLTVIAASAVVLALKALFDAAVTIRALRRSARFDVERAARRERAQEAADYIRLVASRDKTSSSQSSRM